MNKYKKEPGYVYIETSEDKNKCEPKRETDQYLKNGQWIHVIMNDGLFCERNIYRRKVAAPATGWVRFDEREPLENDYPIWATVGDGKDAFLFKMKGSEAFLSRPILYWQPATVPAPPVVKSQEDMDRDMANAWADKRAIETHCFPDWRGQDVVDAYLAGLAQWRKEKL